MKIQNKYIQLHSNESRKSGHAAPIETVPFIVKWMRQHCIASLGNCGHALHNQLKRILQDPGQELNKHAQ